MGKRKAIFCRPESYLAVTGVNRRNWQHWLEWLIGKRCKFCNETTPRDTICYVKTTSGKRGVPRQFWCWATCAEDLHTKNQC